MLGAIIGDKAGSRFEFEGVKSKDFGLLTDGRQITDDAIMTVAVADALLRGADMARTLRDWGRRYETCYGTDLQAWIDDDGMGPYGSWSNGAAMRVSAAAWLADDFAGCMEMARHSSEPTHDHPEGIRGAQASAAALYAARTGLGPQEIRRLVADVFGYDMNRTADQIRPDYEFEIDCARSVPEALICALESVSLEDAVRTAISLGGDADTQAAIAGSVAEALHGVPPDLETWALAGLPDDMLEVVQQMRERVRNAAAPAPVPDEPSLVSFRWDPSCIQIWEAAQAAAMAEKEAHEKTLTAPISAATTPASTAPRTSLMNRWRESLKRLARRPA